jgi:hypothetical protein
MWVAVREMLAGEFATAPIVNEYGRCDADSY